ncbi:MAG TPA: hypothetical protein EYN79_09830 [Planctomycetes bacterium]|nr:hypothetical protein [Planctomycetota bacterium]HIN80699.1 hypothetical protein [Planctomycetota bacterium]
MRITPGILALTLILLFTAEARAQDPPLRGRGGFAAIVNGDAITIHTLDLEISQRLRASGTQFSPEQLAREQNSLRAVVLRRLIEQRLLLQMSSRHGYTVSPQEVDASILRRLEMLRQQDPSLRTIDDFFIGWEAEFGETEREARTTISEQLLIERLMIQEVYKEKYVSPARLRTYYYENKEEFRTEGFHTIRQILIPVDDPDAHQLIALIVKEREKGRDFGELATLHSVGPRASEGGAFTLTDSQLDSRFAPLPEVVRKLEIGEVSKPFESTGFILIVELRDRKEGTPLPFEEAQPQIRNSIRVVQREMQRKKFEETLYRDARIQIFIEGYYSPQGS